MNCFRATNKASKDIDLELNVLSEWLDVFLHIEEQVMVLNVHLNWAMILYFNHKIDDCFEEYKWLSSGSNFKSAPYLLSTEHFL